jgi:hypothetical protein
MAGMDSMFCQGGGNKTQGKPKEGFSCVLVLRFTVL